MSFVEWYILFVVGRCMLFGVGSCCLLFVVRC